MQGGRPGRVHIPRCDESNWHRQGHLRRPTVSSGSPSVSSWLETGGSSSGRVKSTARPWAGTGLWSGRGGREEGRLSQGTGAAEAVAALRARPVAGTNKALAPRMGAVQGASQARQDSGTCCCPCSRGSEGDAAVARPTPGAHARPVQVKGNAAIDHWPRDRDHLRR